MLINRNQAYFIAFIDHKLSPNQFILEKVPIICGKNIKGGSSRGMVQHPP